MDNLQLFRSDDGMFQMRIIIDANGKEFYIAKDAVESVGCEWQSNSIAHVPEEWKGAKAVNTPGGIQQMKVLTEEGLNFFMFRSDKSAAMPFQKWVAGEILPTIRRTGTYSVQPKSQVEALLESVQLLAAQEKRLAQLEDKTAIINHRIDNLDLTNIEGTPRQRLVKMVQRYANQKGITYSAAWHDFTSAYNVAYRTNLKARINRYSSKMSTPEYLDGVGEIEDAIRVADKMLNQVVES